MQFSRNDQLRAPAEASHPEPTGKAEDTRRDSLVVRTRLSCGHTRRLDRWTGPVKSSHISGHWAVGIGAAQGPERASKKLDRRTGPASLIGSRLHRVGIHPCIQSAGRNPLLADERTPVLVVRRVKNDRDRGGLS